MARILGILVFIFMVVMLIPTGLVLASQNSVPGDTTYPIKRKLEDVIISVASLHPTTKAYFRVDFSKRRFKETTELILRGHKEDAVKSFNDLNSQTQQALDDVTKLSDKYKKLEYLEAMIKEADERSKKYEELQQNIPAQANKSKPSPTPFPTSAASTSRLVDPNSKPTSTPVPATPTPRSTAPTYNVDPAIVAALEQARQENEKYKKKLEEEKERAKKEAATLQHQNSSSQQPTAAPIPPTATPAPQPSYQAENPTATPIPSSGNGEMDVEGYNALRSNASPTPSRAPTPTPFRTPTPVAEFATAGGDGIATPTPRFRSTTPTSVPPDGCPSGSTQVQCMSDSEKSVYGSGVNAVCYNSSGTGTGNICYAGCGACN